MKTNRRTPSLLIRWIIPLGLLLIPACSTLPLQKKLAGHVTDALRTCQKQPERCAAAKRCKDAAIEAAQALQDARGAELAGTLDQAGMDAGLRAVSLPPAALAQCQALGFKYVAPPSETVPPRASSAGGLADRLGAMATPAAGVQ